jgi:hypothetical protein
MNGFKILGLLLLISFIVNANCEYNERYQINDVYLNTIYPELGTDIEIYIEIESETFSTTTLQIIIDEGYYKKLIIEEEIYLSEGINKFKYETKISENFGHNIGIVKVMVGSKNHEVPIFINNEKTGLIKQYDSEENISLNIKSEEPIQFNIDTGTIRKINARPINGTINLNIEKCKDCEMIISFEYEGDEYNIYNKFGEYVKPYVRINNIEEKQVEVISCPLREIDIVRFETGYETIISDGHSFDLSKFSSEEINEIEILENKPLKIKIKASDNLERIVESSGILFIECETTSFMNEIEFIESVEYTYDIDMNTTCNITYGNTKKSTEVFMEEKNKEKEQKDEIIYWDDYIMYALIVLAVVLTGVLLHKWRGN